MSGVLTILLVIAVVKSVVFGFLVFVVFRDDIRQYFAEKRDEKVAAAQVPACIYCHSAALRPAGEPETRWDQEELVLVSTFECLECGLPFWHVERVTIAAAKR